MNKRTRWTITGLSLIVASIVLSGCLNSENDDTTTEPLLALCTEESGA